MPTALVTGANRGIGLAFVQSLAEDGWKVHACCRNPDKARNLKQIEGDVNRQRPVSYTHLTLPTIYSV